MSGHVFIFRGRSGQSGKTALVHRRWSVPADKATGTWSLRLALSPRWQSVPDAGATGDADGRYRLATAKAVTDIPDHVVALFILVVAE
ncbi:ISSfl3 orfB [Escherichia coli P12b]|nr:ISSfl3 orfB [Escherichia coli P12b]